MGDGQGWFEYSTPMTLDELRRRQVENDALLAELDEQIERSRIAEFGHVLDPVTETVRLPLSNYTFEWRTDGYYRVTEPDGPDDEPGDGVGEWTSWYLDGSAEGARQHPDGVTAGGPWRLYFGCARPTWPVTFQRAGDLDVRVVRLGHLWIAEWRGRTGAVAVTVGDDVITLGPRAGS